MTKQAPRHELTQDEIGKLMAALVAKRDALLAAQRAIEGKQRILGEVEAEDGDVAEQFIEQESALRLAAFDAKLLTEVEHALTKMDNGNYGVSEQSGVPIPFPRLEAIPWARRTADEEERQQ